MSDPVVTNITYRQVQAQDATHFQWDVEFTAVTSKGTRVLERKGFGTLAAGLTVAQVKAAVLQIALDYDNAEKNPPAPPANIFAGTFDAVDGTKITSPTDPRLPPGVSP
jgi:hypothetical protein